MRSGTPPRNSRREWGRYESLSEKTRKWLIVYGVGIAALFITQANVLAPISLAEKLWILIPALLAALLQLVLDLTIKFANLIIYKAHLRTDRLSKKRCSYQLARWWTQIFMIDIIIDVITVVLYIVATSVLVSAVASTGF